MQTASTIIAAISCTGSSIVKPRSCLCRMAGGRWPEMDKPKFISRRTLQQLPEEKRLFMEEVLIPEGKYQVVDDELKVA